MSSAVSLSEKATNIHVYHAACERDALGTNRYSTRVQFKQNPCHTILTTITCYTEIHYGIKDREKQPTSSACTGGSKWFSIFTEMFMDAAKKWEDIMSSIPTLLAMMPWSLGFLESSAIAPSRWHMVETGVIEP
jgi:hypothetical protein